MDQGKVIIIGSTKQRFVAELKKAAKSDDLLRRCMAASASQTPVEILQQLCNDPEPLVRWCVLRNTLFTPKAQSLPYQEFAEMGTNYTVSYKFTKEKGGIHWAELEVSKAK